MQFPLKELDGQILSLNLQSLKKLSLDNDNMITSLSLAYIAKKSLNLEELSIEGTGVSDNGVSALKDLSKLRILRVAK